MQPPLIAVREGQHTQHPNIPVTTIQGRNVIFSLCDEESAATWCIGIPPHKHSEEFRPVPSIASTIEHIGESRLGARDQSCIRPAIGAQTPSHDIRWLRLSASAKGRRGYFYCSRRCNRSAIFEGIGSFGTSPYSFRTSFPTQILKARATRRSVSSAVIVHS